MRAGGCGAVDGLVHGQVLAGAGGVHVVAVEREVRVEIRQLTLHPVAVAASKTSTASRCSTLGSDLRVYRPLGFEAT